MQRHITNPRGPWFYALLLAIVGCVLDNANATASVTTLPPTNLLAVSCDGFKTAKKWCEVAQPQLPTMTQINTRLTMTLTLPVAMIEQAKRMTHSASRRLLQGKGSAKQLADLGLAQIFTDQTAEGVQSLLASAARKPTTGVLDWAFVGFAALYPELSTLQQREWSSDMAGRVMRLSLDARKTQPRPLDVARVAQLYKIAGDAKLSAQIATTLQRMQQAPIRATPPSRVATRSTFEPHQTSRNTNTVRREPRGGFDR